MKKQLAPDLSALISTAAAAQLLMVTPTWLRRLERDGWFAKAERGQYRLTDLVQGFIRHLRDEDRRATKTASFAKVQDSRAEEIQLRIDERRKVQIAAGQAAAVQVIDEFFGGLKADLLAIPARVTLDVALRRKIEDGMHDAFDAASKRACAAADCVENAGVTINHAVHGAPRRKRR